MSLDRTRGPGRPAHPGEPAIGPDLPPPFQPPDAATSWLFALNRFGIRPGLDRINALLAGLGHPERRLRTIVVAGTNGKGSTTRALAGLLQSSGHRVATYTSPHLLQVYERILIDDVPLLPDEFAARVTAMRPLAEEHGASWFEVMTAMAVAAASDAKVDFLCCEAGLGGRLDASNALPAAATVLTTVGLDHQAILGSTLEAIAAEKLGLLKRGVPLFCGVDEGLRAQVFRAAVEAGSPCHFLDELARWEPPCGDPSAWTVALRDRSFAGLPDPGTAALRRNVALTLLTLAELEKRTGDRLLPAEPASALGDLFLPGRFHVVLREPDWIFDTAHNEQALHVALDAFLERNCGGRRYVLFGAMHDKDLAIGIGGYLHRCDGVVAAPVGLPRSRTTAELRTLFEAWGFVATEVPADGCASGFANVAPDLGAALGIFARILEPTDSVLVTGSCFVVAETLHRLGFADLGATRVPRSAGPILAGWERETL